ncbi:MAG: dihydroorotase [Chloroflexi bacterium]|nr:dihydroorotase [Chloroflexota bacterium]
MTATAELPLLVTGGRVLDPNQGLDALGDVLVEGGRVAWVWRARQGERPRLPARYRTLEAHGLVVCPGFIDLHCHLREPGQEHKETIGTGTRAAARGGFTTVCAMANTEPAIDTAGLVEYVRQRAKEAACVRVLPLATITVGRRGDALADMEELAAAGAVGFSDDGAAVRDAQVMRNALTMARSLGLPIIQHCEDPALAGGAVAHEGWVATRLGLKGSPSAAEVSLAARDIALAALTGGRLHLAHISAAETLPLLRRAKENGTPVSAEVTPHHLALSHEWLLGERGEGWPPGKPYDTSLRVNPPLRRPEDAAALAAALREGLIDAIATDHAPHAWEDKAVPFAEAAPGISGLETALGLLLALVHRGVLDLRTVIERLTAGPARLLPAAYRDLGSLREGAPADIAIFDPEREWMVRPEEFASKGKNTPLAGCVLHGQVMATIAGGQIVHCPEGVRVQEEAPERG